jgi:hypothetical protein
MTQATTVPGAGTLRGSEFLLFSDWKMLGDQPGLNLFEQTNKVRDILIKIVVIVEESEDIAPEVRADTAALKPMLEALMTKYLDFGEIEGSHEWKNEYWIGLTGLFYHLFKIQRKLELIETSSQEHLKVPEQ